MPRRRPDRVQLRRATARAPRPATGRSAPTLARRRGPKALQDGVRNVDRVSISLRASAARPSIANSPHPSGRSPAGMFMYAMEAMAAAVRRAVITGAPWRGGGRLHPIKERGRRHSSERTRRSELDETRSSGRCDGLAAASTTEFPQNRRDVRSYGVDRPVLIVRDSLVAETLRHGGAAPEARPGSAPRSLRVRSSGRKLTSQYLGEARDPGDAGKTHLREAASNCSGTRLISEPRSESND